MPHWGGPHRRGARPLAHRPARPLTSPPSHRPLLQGGYFPQAQQPYVNNGQMYGGWRPPYQQPQYAPQQQPQQQQQPQRPPPQQQPSRQQAAPAAAGKTLERNGYADRSVLVNGEVAFQQDKKGVSGIFFAPFADLSIP